MSVLTGLTLAEARRKLRAREIGAVELTEAHLAAIEALDGRLNSFRHPHAGRGARGRRPRRDGARGGRGGRAHRHSARDQGPVLHRRDRTTAASRILDGFVPPYESTVTAKLLADGAVFLGKTNLDEFAMGSSNMTSAYGPVENPWKRRGDNAAEGSDGARLVPGGSSGGSAAAVAARLALGATATDTGGSIRQPAAFCGIAGIKPTYGRCSRFGTVAFASSLDQAGPLARTVEDCAILLGSMSGFDPRDSTSADQPVPPFEAACGRSLRGMRIGIPREYRLEGTSPEITALWEQGIAWARDAGAEIREVSLPHTKYGLATYYIVAPAECSSNLARYDGVRFTSRSPGADLTELYENSRADGFGDEVKRRILIGTYVLSCRLFRRLLHASAQKVRALIAARLQRCLQIAGRPDPDSDGAVGGVRAGGEDRTTPIAMYLE